MKEYVIKFGNQAFKASKYQNVIFNNVEFGSGNMVISAAAGSSKTTTIINCINIIKKTKKVLFIAFNKEIVKNIQERVGDRKNTMISTFHKLGLLIFNENYESSSSYEINEYKYKNYIRNNIKKLTKFKEVDSLKKDKITYINNIISLIEYSRYYLAFSIKEIEKVAEKYGISTIRDEAEVCRKVLKWGKKEIDEIDFTDMIWLPNVLNMTTKKYKFDWLLIDEAQDCSIAEQKLIEKCFKRGSRFITVGDEFQQINLWCGSTEESIDNFKNIPNTKEFKLPISYRCPKKIVNLASKYSNNIIPSDTAIEGEVNYDVSKFAPSENDMVLCRTTAPLIELYLDYIRINKKSYIKGFENIKNEYLNLINSTKSVIIDADCMDKKGLFSNLYRILLEKIDHVKNNYNIDDNDALLHPYVYMTYDAIEGIKVLSEGLTEVSDLINKINIIFDSSNKEGVQLSTVHKAKGLEADNVYILCPSLMPSKYAKKEWEIKSERNLMYVAITRAKKTLNYIEESKKVNTIGNSFDINSMKHNIDEIKNKLTFCDNLSILNAIKKPHKLGEAKNNIKNESKPNLAQVTPKIKKKAALRFAAILK